jgi:SAM-dependent methyltransferase
MSIALLADVARAHGLGHVLLAGPAAAIPAFATRHELVNRTTWSNRSTLRQFARSEGWSDRGEEAALRSLAPTVRGGAILDLGVGAGRTVPLLRDLSADYRAIDFLPPMVQECAARFPDVDVTVGDARDLSRFADASMDLVVFSWNGIDAVAHEDRAAILSEVHRVLVPGGAFQFSTHNLDGPGWHEKPWTVQAHDVLHPRRLASIAAFLPLNVRNHRRNRVAGPSGPGWGMANAGAHHFSLVIHYIALAAQRDALVAAGFTDIEAWDERTGQPIPSGHDTADAWWFQLVARKAVEAPPDEHPPVLRLGSPPTTYHRTRIAPLTGRGHHRALRWT